MKQFIFSHLLLLACILCSCASQKPLTELESGKREMVIYFPSKRQRLQWSGEGSYADSQFLGLGLETKKLYFERRSKELFKGQSKRVAVTTDTFLLETRTGIFSGAAETPAQLTIPAGTDPIYVRITQSYSGPEKRISGAMSAGYVSQNVRSIGDNLALVPESFFLREMQGHSKLSSRD